MMLVMKERRISRRLLAIIGLGILGCAVAVGVRATHRKPIYGTWTGFSYQNIDGKLVADKEFGQYTIELGKDGTYEENGNATSGTWVHKDDKITLTPTKFYDMTPEQHRKKYTKKDGKVSVTIQRLLAMRMKPMTISYVSWADKLEYREPSMLYIYERT